MPGPTEGRIGGGPWLLLLAFTGGVVSLGLEISASRLLAPFFGASTLIWGVLIGLILLYLTLGYFAGGWAADRWPEARRLYTITAIAAALVLLIPLISRPVLLFSQSALQGFQVGAFVGALIAVILIFAPSVITLGMVSPWVIRLRVDRVGVAGRTAGTVYAISTAGSILGAFLPAFWWIPSFGVRNTIYGLGVVLLVVSAAGGAIAQTRRVLAISALCALPLAGAALPYGPIRPASDGISLYESDSEYGYIQVLHRDRENDLLLNEGQAVHSIYNPDEVLTGGPWDYFSLAPLFAIPDYSGQPPKDALIIGLAGGTVARQLTAAYGSIAIDGVEIDPRIIEVGRRYFDMNEPNLNAVTADGRYFLAGTSKRYDLVVVDAYRQPYIPFHLATREFFQEARRHLTDRGVLAINAGRAPGDYRLVNAVTGTIGAAFPDVYRIDTERFLNTVVFAANDPLPEARVRANFDRPRSVYPELVARVLDEARSGAGPVRDARHDPVWTDDLAPVERLVDSMILNFIGSH